MEKKPAIRLKPLTLDKVEKCPSKNGESQIIVTVKGYRLVFIRKGNDYNFFHTSGNGFPCPVCFYMKHESEICKKQKDMAVFIDEIRLRTIM